MCTLIWVAPRLSADIKELDEVCTIYVTVIKFVCVCTRVFDKILNLDQMAQFKL